MNWSRRLLVLLGVALLAGTVWIFWDGPTAPEGQSLPDEKERGSELEERRQHLLWRHHRQSQVVQDLVTGRCTLLAAAARFRALYRKDSVLDQALRDTYPAPTEDERICRWVINYTRTDQDGNPWTAELVARLERELREHLEHGTLQIPEE
jgi:hypothetical protein